MKNQILDAFERGDTTFEYFSPATRYITSDGKKIPLIAFLIQEYSANSDSTDDKTRAAQFAIIRSLIHRKNTHGRYDININNHTKFTGAYSPNLKALDIALLFNEKEIAEEIIKRPDISFQKPVRYIVGHGEVYMSPFAIACKNSKLVARKILNDPRFNANDIAYKSQYETLTGNELIKSKYKIYNEYFPPAEEFE